LLREELFQLFTAGLIMVSLLESEFGFLNSHDRTPEITDHLHIYGLCTALMRALSLFSPQQRARVPNRPNQPTIILPD
jgi:hypothetical protein